MMHLCFQEGPVQSSEFYINDIPVLFLSDLKDVNIIIGANNTRKSRFLRHIIKQDRKIIIEAKHDLNQHIQDSYKIFEDFQLNTDQIMLENLLNLSFRNSDSPSKEYKELEGYFADKTSKTNGVFFFDLDSSINNTLVSSVAFSAAKTATIFSF